MATGSCSKCGKAGQHLTASMCNTCYRVSLPNSKCIKCNKERPHKAKGLCQSCYNGENKQQKASKTCVKCHEEKKIVGKGMCGKCYQRERNSKEPTKTCVKCHQERILVGKEMCRSCYDAEFASSAKKGKTQKCIDCGLRKFVSSETGKCSDCLKATQGGTCLKCGTEKRKLTNGICYLCLQATLPTSACQLCGEYALRVIGGYCVPCYNRQSDSKLTCTRCGSRRPQHQLGLCTGCSRIGDVDNELTYWARQSRQALSGFEDRHFLRSSMRDSRQDDLRQGDLHRSPFVMAPYTKRTYAKPHGGVISQIVSIPQVPHRGLLRDVEAALDAYLAKHCRGVEDVEPTDEDIQQTEDMMEVESAEEGSNQVAETIAEDTSDNQTFARQKQGTLEKESTLQKAKANADAEDAEMRSEASWEEQSSDSSAEHDGDSGVNEEEAKSLQTSAIGPDLEVIEVFHRFELEDALTQRAYRALREGKLVSAVKYRSKYLLPDLGSVNPYVKGPAMAVWSRTSGHDLPPVDVGRLHLENLIVGMDWQITRHQEEQRDPTLPRTPHVASITSFTGQQAAWHPRSMVHNATNSAVDTQWIQFLEQAHAEGREVIIVVRGMSGYSVYPDAFESIIHRFGAGANPLVVRVAFALRRNFVADANCCLPPGNYPFLLPKNDPVNARGFHHTALTNIRAIHDEYNQRIVHPVAHRINRWFWEEAAARIGHGGLTPALALRVKSGRGRFRNRIVAG